MESRYVHKQHNVSVLMYHVVCAAKYRRVVMSEDVDEVVRDVCLEIEKRWEIYFLEIGMDRDHAHFLVQSVPSYNPTKIVQTVKSLTARELFVRAPEVKKKWFSEPFYGDLRNRSPYSTPSLRAFMLLLSGSNDSSPLPSFRTRFRSTPAGP